MTASSTPDTQAREGAIRLAGADHAGARFVCATVGNHRLAFPIDAVQEVLAPRAITRLFHAPPSLLGVVNLRGAILPVVDLLLLLGHASSGDPTQRLARRAFGDDARLIVLRAHVSPDAGSPRSAAVKTASIAVLVAHLDPLRDGDVEPLPSGVPSEVSRLALGIVAAASHAVVVIDPDKLVDVEELARLRAESLRISCVSATLRAVVI